MQEFKTKLNAAYQLHSAGRLTEAIREYKCLLAEDKASGYVLLLLGTAYCQIGEPHEGVSCLERAAIADPTNPIVFYNLGNVLKELGRFGEATHAFKRALEIKPDFAEAYSNLGIVLEGQNRYDEALECHNNAISLNSIQPEFFNNLGGLLKRMARLSEALNAFDLAIKLDQSYVEAYSNRGALCFELKKFDEALASCDKAILIDSNYVEAYGNKSAVLLELRRYDEAIVCCDKAILIKSDYADAYSNRGAAFFYIKMYDEAIESCKKAIHINPNYPDAYYNLANALYAVGLQSDAISNYENALRLNPHFVQARWWRAMSELPIVATGVGNVKLSRPGFCTQLAEMDRWFFHTRLSSAYKAVGLAQPFYLAYQEEANRNILSKYGELCCRLMKGLVIRDECVKTSPRNDNRIKVGVVASHIRQHSVWNAITKGWVQNLNPKRFELHFFHTGHWCDDETNFAKSIAAGFSEGSDNLSELAQAIMAEQFDVLLYPEIGMDTVTTMLANVRLSSVQVASWGHPETTGLPTIDYYLSANLFEPPNAQKHYSERLVQLPNLGVCIEESFVRPESFDLSSLGIAAGQPVLICPGTPFKYQPQFDHVFVEIAKELGSCQFVFFTYEIRQLTEKLRKRLFDVFLAAGLDMKRYVVFVPWQKKEGFYGLMKKADLFLDTIGFSGFNTAIQAVECGLPIVTREGRFMRGRLASGLLKRIGLGELVARNEADYVSMAVNLIRNCEYNQYIRSAIASSRNVLYNDKKVIVALEAFLEKVSSSSLNNMG